MIALAFIVFLMLNPAAAMSPVAGEQVGSELMRSEAKEHAVQPEEKLVPGPANPASRANQHAGVPQNDASTASTAAPKKRVHIQLYYETRCPDCVQFLNQTLEPITENKDFKDLYKLDLNPYGNAQSVPMQRISEGYRFWHPDTTSTDWEFVHICQHGEDECFGNLIQACAIMDEPVEKHAALVFCMAGHPNWGIEKSSYECMQKVGIDHTKNRDCVKSARGNKLLMEFGKKTQAVRGRTGTPWVLVNGAHVDDPSKLLQNVCGAVDPGSDKVSTCKQFHGASAKDSDDDTPDSEGTFGVFPKLKSVPRELAILPPPEHV